MNPGFHCTGQMADSVYGVVWVSGFAEVNVVDRMAHGGGVVMVWAGAELGRLLTNCNPLLIPDYMTKIVVSNVIRYITHFR